MKNKVLLALAITSMAVASCEPNAAEEAAVKEDANNAAFDAALQSIKQAKNADEAADVEIPADLESVKFRKVRDARADRVTNFYRPKMEMKDGGSSLAEAVALYVKEIPNGRPETQQASSALILLYERFEKEIEATGGNKPKLRALYRALPSRDKGGDGLDGLRSKLTAAIKS